MKKTFPLTASGKDDARVRDKIRQEINKYVRRELRKTLPEGVDRWEFKCQLGVSQANAEPLPLKQIGQQIDAVAQSGADQVYVEIIAVAGERKKTGF